MQFLWKTDGVDAGSPAPQCAKDAEQRDLPKVFVDFDGEPFGMDTSSL